ncbi:hypothetical protein [Metabacillus endolithicus]|uniref:Uncharacterized protein n=1 Tax=Metabacillus endolithicus TaxID=1535204 RepID=A0ABW5C5H4_9BACI|nr:hypothetical protein [Metabacillus endolithicus]UPG66052.1 hypothetical protein MVE64_26790 [Metabacillus endolithicus]
MDSTKGSLIGKNKPCFEEENIEQTKLIVVNVITGLFVTISSVIGYIFSGIGKGSTNDFTILIWLFIWVIGLFYNSK